MAHMQPLKLEEIEELKPFLATAEYVLGFTPNSLLTLARKPQILEGFSVLSKAVFPPGTVSSDLKMMVAHVSSTAAGCRYCQAHSVTASVRAGVPMDKILAARGDFENDSQFSEAEKAALKFAQDAAKIPNVVTSDHFDQLRKHFNDEQIVELMAVISTMGWLNRWNDTMATQLEKEPLTLATENISASGWTAGKHSPST